MVALFVRPRKSARKVLRRYNFRSTHHGVARPRKFSTEPNFVRSASNGTVTDMVELLPPDKAPVIRTDSNNKSCNALHVHVHVPFAHQRSTVPAARIVTCQGLVIVPDQPACSHSHCATCTCSHHRLTGSAGPRRMSSLARHPHGELGSVGLDQPADIGLPN